MGKKRGNLVKRGRIGPREEKMWKSREKEWKAMRRSSRSVVRLEAEFTESAETAPKGAAR
ncbi:hypothetical protein D3Z36_17360 [Lachnospiraceae bacterium]|uniref:Uncharacterized protein n=1 Tax=Anaerotruncus colihominis TaxID=169435 RepID=A0A845QNQ2_9FIRM|nr:hypothetical protein [Lachnospiraceae bacterium]NBH63034.1 hypothetical protein [Anaerotruncus colihominis]NBH81236.1 hypothetical protein [Clostridiaceae bacterium]NCF03688.1 hypothetical protein [Anaerotruncus sp. 80]NBI61423.1 hypothetical protein [Lachnospiraceae bacterium]